MPIDPSKHHRRSIRLREYDYSWTGWYYVTICTANRQCTLGKIVNDAIVYSAIATIVRECWEGIPEQFPFVELDDAVIMPNHLHGIVILNEPRRGLIHQTRHEGLINQAPTEKWISTKDPRITLGKVIRAFKARAARLVHRDGHLSFQWQRNYYEHIIRDNADLHRIRIYMQNNPLQWALDEENPVNNT